MINSFKFGLAAALAAGSVAAVALPASAAGFGGHGGGGGHFAGGGHGGFGGGRGYGGARAYGGGYGYRGGGYGGYGGGWYGPGAVVAGGLAGLAIGSALASPYYDGYGYAGDACVAPQSVWDPYYGRYVVRQVPYPC